MIKLALLPVSIALMSAPCLAEAPSAKPQDGSSLPMCLLRAADKYWRDRMDPTQKILIASTIELELQVRRLQEAYCLQTIACYDLIPGIQASETSRAFLFSKCLEEEAREQYDGKRR